LTTQPLSLLIDLTPDTLTLDTPTPDTPTPDTLTPATVLAEAEAILDPTLETLRAIVDDQARIAATLAQAAAIIEQHQTFQPANLQPANLPTLLSAIHRLSTQLEQTELKLAAAEARLHSLEPANLLTFQPATQLLSRSPLFLDLETTGLKKTDAVVEVAVIDAQGHVLLSTLVNPGRPIPPEVSAINGLTDDLVADAPRWTDVEPLLEPILTGRVVVAHNAKFEAKFLPPWQIDWVCSKDLADATLGKQDGRGGLAARLAQLGLQPGPAHSAAGDCLSTLRLVKHLAGDPSPVQLTY
jgi:hypothetical protein